MKISTQYVNTPIKKYEVEINWRSIMNYAASVEDDNSYYFDDEREGGIVAPPMFAVAVTWPIVENLSLYIQDSDFPIKVFKTVVHYAEYLKIHRLIKPNDKLIIKGYIASIQPRRSGTYILTRLDAIDNNNEDIFTEFIGGLLRGVKCIGEPRGHDKIHIVPSCDNKDIKIWEKSVYLDKLRQFVYDGCTDIFFPIHTSKKFAHFV